MSLHIIANDYHAPPARISKAFDRRYSAIESP